MENVVTWEQYERARRLHPANYYDAVFNAFVRPRWISGSQFWYIREIRLEKGTGRQYVIVDAEQNTSQPAFDHERLAVCLSGSVGKRYDAETLPLGELMFTGGGSAFQFEVGGTVWSCDLQEYNCKPLHHFKKPSIDELPSPDGKWVAFVYDHNLYVRSLETGRRIRLTHDGKAYYDYGTQPECRLSTVAERLNDRKLPPVAIWSPDSKMLLTHRLDQRKVREMHLIQSVPKGEEVRPVLHSYRYPLVGDQHVPLAELVICDLERRTTVWIESEPLLACPVSPLTPGMQMAGWSSDSKQIYIARMSRDARSVDFSVADACSGEVCTLLREQSDTFLNQDLHNLGASNPNIRLMADGSFIWHSERDGWSHLYYCDGKTGEIRNPITSGPWTVRRLMAVDEQQGWVYITGGGLEEGRDPYYQHLYRVRLDGTGLSLLTPEDAEHNVVFSPNMKYFVDTFSRVDLPPVSVLRSVDGSLIRELEYADVEMLLEMGYQFPERITVKARDGVTDLYGVMLRPFPFDPSSKYPVIDYIYGGPQIINTPKAFALDPGRSHDPLGGGQSLAQLGFIVLILDGMGTPYRSKAFHDISNGKLEEAGGLIDHVIAIKQLAERYPYVDVDRVGIWGSSGGGYASTRALLSYPEFYKAAVSASGNHDQRLYIAAWAERYQGLYDPDLYRDQDNARLAANLAGKLLLVSGDMDDNVHPSQTIRMANALIKADKDFDMLILPNRHHGFSLEPYFIRRKWDYFVRHLMRAEPPWGNQTAYKNASDKEPIEK
ncbi:DPP IV N-terminal domain-containing protein [Brevibacillus formosus]|uniref:Dipeptidyl peptidase IV n=1 Tax=Brevibacillus formosus TaxID=54913 RepID=A0A837KMI3_9BACL|nr:DPP IV N-terminal domain-containing protein [Brevibacillus formosus]KLH98867.1 peptidase S9 [Brevibacillus formosus]MED1958171.1 DPP IV N-terminal domain-containing protein [Brevibacillus formosus]PSJ93583.1 peptidase S9 [Brevibacillus formosus]GED59496.1 putative dipeptidyl peptidase IV [Brevibacillus formosus]